MDNAYGLGYLCQPGVYILRTDCPLLGGWLTHVDPNPNDERRSR
jgi:hypothetical protein